MLRYTFTHYRRTRHRQRGRGLHAVRKGVVEQTTRWAQDDRQRFVDAIDRSERVQSTHSHDTDLSVGLSGDIDFPYGL